jgi:hypothetical protein
MTTGLITPSDRTTKILSRLPRLSTPVRTYPGAKMVTGANATVRQSPQDQSATLSFWPRINLECILKIFFLGPFAEIEILLEADRYLVSSDVPLSVNTMRVSSGSVQHPS